MCVSKLCKIKLKICVNIMKKIVVIDKINRFYSFFGFWKKEVTLPYPIVFKQPILIKKR